MHRSQVPATSSGSAGQCDNRDGLDDVDSPGKPLEMGTSHWVPDPAAIPLLIDATVGGRLREIAAEVPDRVALVEGLSTPKRRRWTFVGLLGDAKRCAGHLLRHFEPGERVAVWAHNVPEWILLEYGAALAGLTLVTVNPSLQPAEAQYILGQSRVAGLFVVPRSGATS